MVAVNLRTDGGVQLKIYKFLKIEAEQIRPVPKERGAVEIEIKTSLSELEKSVDKVRRIFSRVDLSIQGRPAQDAEDQRPVFKMQLVVQGRYDYEGELSLDEMNSSGLGIELAAPLYSLAVGEANALAAKFDLPRIQVPLLLPERKVESARKKIGSAVSKRAVSTRQATRKSASKEE